MIPSAASGCRRDRLLIPGTATVAGLLSESHDDLGKNASVPAPSRRTVGDGAHDLALRRDPVENGLLDGSVRDQVPGRHRRRPLADAMAPVLRLIVHRWRPVQFDERDVRGGGERDPILAAFKLQTMRLQAGSFWKRSTLV